MAGRLAHTTRGQVLQFPRKPGRQSPERDEIPEEKERETHRPTRALVLCQAFPGLWDWRRDGHESGRAKFCWNNRHSPDLWDKQLVLSRRREPAGGFFVLSVGSGRRSSCCLGPAFLIGGGGPRWVSEANGVGSDTSTKAGGRSVVEALEGHHRSLPRLVDGRPLKGPCIWI